VRRYRNRASSIPSFEGVKPSESVVDSVGITLPLELADELFGEDLAVRPLRRRSADWVALATLAVDTVAVLVAVVVSRDDLAEVARRFAGHARRASAEAPTITVQITLGDNTETLTEPNSDDGQRRIEVRVTAQLTQDASSEQ
jgi:hypothetical protein